MVAPVVQFMFYVILARW